jgi:hypothetical protein
MSTNEVPAIKSTASTRKVQGYQLEPVQPLVAHIAKAVHKHVADSIATPIKGDKRLATVSDVVSSYGQPSRIAVDDSGKLQLTWLIPAHRSKAALSASLRDAEGAGFKGAFLDFSFSLHKHVLVLRG